MAEISKKDIDIFNGLFEIDIKYLLKHIRDYKEILLQQAKNSKSTTVIFDKEFMSNLAREGFLRSIKQYHRLESEYDEAGKSIMDQVNDILDIE